MNSNEVLDLFKSAIRNEIPGYVFTTVKPLWNNRQQIDLYCSELELAIDIQGRKHYMRPCRSKEDIDTKRDNCKNMCITLFEHRYDEKVDILIQKTKID